MAGLIPNSAELRPSDVQNLEPQTDAEAGRGHLSHSAITMLLACQRRWGWHYDAGLEQIARPRPLAMGSAFHKAIELRDPVKGAAEMDRPTADQAEYDSLLKDKAIVACAAAAYMARWPEEARTRELKYRIRLRSPYTGAYSRTFDLVGAADGVIDHGAYLELEEDKLVGRIDEITVKKVALDRQLGLTCYALWRVTGKPVRVVRKRFIKKPSIKQRQNETVEQFCARVAEDYEARPDFYAIEPPPSYITSADLLRIECELWVWAEQLRALRRAKVYDRNTSACGDYGGCQYLPLCAGDPDAKALFHVRPERES